MQLTATLRYDEGLVRQAVLRYWCRSMGIGMLAAVAVVLAGLIWRLAEGDRSWVVGMLATVVALGIVLPAAVYLVHYRNAMSKFREMASPVASLVADEGSFTVTSDRGTSTLRWDAITEVWCFRQFWLLLFSKAHFMTVPLRDVPEPVKSFILDRVRAAGGKVSV